MKILSKQNLMNSFLFIALFYVIQLMIVYFFTGEFVIKKTETLLFSSVSCFFSYCILKNNKYWHYKIILMLMFFSLVFLKMIVYSNIEANFENKSLTIEFVKYISFVFCTINLFFILVSFINKLKYKYFFRLCLLIILCLPLIIIWGYYFSTSAWLNTDAVLAIMQTNLNEAQEYLHDYLATEYYGILFVFVLFLIIFNKRLNKIQLKGNKKYVFLAIAAMLFNIFGIYKARDNTLMQIIIDTNMYLQRYEQFEKFKAERKENIEKILNIDNKGEDGIYVLVIGESQNKNHMAAYGYDRETTPWLDFIKNRSEFILFNNAYSCEVQTVKTLSYALTAKNQYNDINLPEAVSLLEVAEASGFETVWMSNQIKYGLFDTPITVIASEANQQFWINDNVGETTRTKYYDLELVNIFDKINYHKKMLIVVHLMGNHGSYSERYPKNFSKFSGNKTVDDYDNSILYNDFVMKNLYNKLLELPDFKCMVYFSDHAEDVKRHLGHNSDTYTSDMIEIPFYICLSDNFIEKYPEKLENLKKAQNNYFTNDLIFNTMLSLMNIENKDIYEAENDIVSNDYNANPKRFKTLFGRKEVLKNE